MALWNLKGRTILVVDDFPEMRSMLRSMLAMYGADTIEQARNGEEAIGRMQARRFEIVLCDYNLGEGKDGQQVLEDAKRRDLLPYDTTFVMVTAENTPEMVMGALEYQPDAYLYRINELGYTLNVVENDVEEVVEECFLEQEAFMQVQGVEFEMDCDPDLVWFFDRELVSSVLNSVINNAYRYTRDRIRIGAGTVDGRLALFVEDNGPGYPASMQVNSAPDLGQAIDFRSGSTGLGLYFTATIARMRRHKEREGYIELANTGIDGGGRFTLYLP